MPEAHPVNPLNARENLPHHEAVDSEDIKDLEPAAQEVENGDLEAAEVGQSRDNETDFEEKGDDSESQIAELREKQLAPESQAEAQLEAETANREATANRLLEYLNGGSTITDDFEKRQEEVFKLGD
jgi:hypothetical protein